MSLVSLPYMGLLAVSVAAYYVVPKKVRWCVLLAVSYYFYIQASGSRVLYLLLSTLSIYLTALLLQKQNNRLKEIKKLDKELRKVRKRHIQTTKKRIVLLGILFNVGILLCLKYWNFFGGNFNAIFDLISLPIQIPMKKFLLPLGISYYTLMALSYIIDVYRGKYIASHNIGKVALYLSFFPQMTEGPIARFDQTADALYQGNKLSLEHIRTGCYLILWGVFKKMVIADRAAVYVNAVFDQPTQGWVTLLAVALYTLQIYAEFSAAMDIVRGSAWLFGVYLPQNFQRPFFSKSIAEFWRRWHITLGTWLKDYIFYSISLSSMNMKLNRSVKKHIKGNFGKFIVTAFPLFFVWFLNGFWHGATWKYIFYGLYYYLVMMGALLFAPLFDPMKERLKLKTNKAFMLFQIVRTTLLVMLGMLIFRADTLSQAWTMLCGIFTFTQANFMTFGLEKIDFIVLGIGTCMMFFLSLYQELQGNVQVLIDRKSLLLRYGILLMIIALIITFGMYGEGYNAADFIYGGF